MEVKISGLNFATALVYCDRGHPIRRSGWSDKMLISVGGFRQIVTASSAVRATDEGIGGVDGWRGQDWTLEGVPVASGAELIVYAFCGVPAGDRPLYPIDGSNLTLDGAGFDLTNPPCGGLDLRRIDRA